ncbi:MULTISPECIES: methionine ABC transporter ATP-binding protein [unclassified Tsukamurella]|uniref:methionine ABC transporter ATP-binding protein n=1 Tax=unclassified Tsukamurella TaxID=2633480 RepID=UPI0031BACFE4
MGSGGAAVEFRSASKTFSGKHATHALRDVTFTVREGSITGVIGPSGAGKSTLLRTVNGLEKLSTGEVFVHGTEVGTLGERRLSVLRADIGMIFQRFNLMAARTVAGNIEYPLKLAGRSRAERKQRVGELLDFVGLTDKAGQYPSRLSGGQSQRVGIARALASRPRLLLADEATSALDPGTTDEVLALLARINRELGTTILVITHEMDVVRRICDTVAVLDHGRLVDFGDVYEVFAAPSSDATRGLVDAAVHDRPSGDVLARLARAYPGTVVSIAVRDDPSAPDPAEVLVRHGCRPRLIYGGVSEVGERPFGSVTYSVNGPDAAVAAALSELGTAAYRHELREQVQP